MCLHNAVHVASALCLNWNNELAPMLVDPYVDFVDFDLAYVLDGSSEVVLQGVRCDAKKDVDQAVVTYLRE